MTGTAAGPPGRIDELRALYAFNAWATDRVLDRAAELTAEELHRDQGSSFPSVQATLAHILRSETGWVYRWRGQTAPELPERWDLSTVKGLRDAWLETRAAQDAFLDSLDEGALDAEVTYRNAAGDVFAPPLRQMLRHVVNHCTYHRGQVVTLFRQLGYDGVKTDLIHFHRERSAC